MWPSKRVVVSFSKLDHYQQVGEFCQTDDTAIEF
jgi:hypothetical protein